DRHFYFYGRSPDIAQILLPPEVARMKRGCACRDHGNKQYQRNGKLDPMPRRASGMSSSKIRFGHLSPPQSAFTAISSPRSPQPNGGYRRKAIAPKANDTLSGLLI